MKKFKSPYHELDAALKFISKKRFIGQSNIFNDAVQFSIGTLSTLVDEGYVKQSDYGFKITHKGKLFLEQGGFVHQHRSNCCLLYSSIIAAICAVASAIISVVTLLR